MLARLLEQRPEEAAFASRAGEPVRSRTRQKKKKWTQGKVRNQWQLVMLNE